MVKNPPSNARDRSSIPGWGTKIPRAAGQLSPYVPTKTQYSQKKIFFFKQCGKTWGSASSGLQSMKTIGDRMNWEEGKVPLNHWIEQWYHSHPGRNSVRQVEKRNKRSHSKPHLWSHVKWWKRLRKELSLSSPDSKGEGCKTKTSGIVLGIRDSCRVAPHYSKCGLWLYQDHRGRAVNAESRAPPQNHWIGICTWRKSPGDSEFKKQC